MSIQVPKTWEQFCVWGLERAGIKITSQHAKVLIESVLLGKLVWECWVKEKDPSVRLLLVRIVAYIYAHMQHNTYTQPIHTSTRTALGMLKRTQHSERVGDYIEKCLSKVVLVDTASLEMHLPPDCEQWNVLQFVEWVAANTK